MNRGWSIILIAFVLFFLTGFVIFISRPNISPLTQNKIPSTTNTTPTIQPSTSSDKDFPPLYPGVEWGQISEGEVMFSTIDNQTIKLKGYAVESATIEDYAGLFDYYKTRLTSAGWRETSYAFGPNGESYDYEKNGKYFSFGVRLISMDPEKYKAFITYSI